MEVGGNEPDGYRGEKDENGPQLAWQKCDVVQHGSDDGNTTKQGECSEEGAPEFGGFWEETGAETVSVEEKKPPNEHQTKERVFGVFVIKEEQR